MPIKKKSVESKPVDAVKHKDKRVNIPTKELADFAVKEEHAPYQQLYPRDPSLDPQLVWRGKDEQDRKPLEVPTVPIYIQEKISPQAIIENLRREHKKPGKQEQPDLFADFNGIQFEDLIEFYKHEQNWSNRMILGDSLLVMNSLTEKEGLKGKVQMIYMDPPYGIKFGSNWQVSTRKRDVKDGRVEDVSRQPEQVKAFRDTWEIGIHSYLSYMRDRLAVAAMLLNSSGSIFVQIGDENVHLVRGVLDEVFGANNYCSQITFRKTTGKGSGLLDNTYDNLLWYAKDRESTKYRGLFFLRHASADDNYSFVESPDGIRRALTPEEFSKVDALPKNCRVFSPNPLTSQSASSTTLFEFRLEGSVYRPGKGGWKTNEAGMNQLRVARRLTAIGDTLRFIRYFDDFPYQSYNDIWDDTRQSGFGDPKSYVVQTMPRVIERCLLMTTDPGDLVLDPTCGSGTTAFVAEQWGRRWITIDTSRVAITLARARLMSARYPYYLLADSQDGIAKEAELAAKSVVPQKTENDVKKGFVYRRVPHITLKSIANNPDIKEGMTREQVDAAIQKHADIEFLFDQPYQHNKRIRVTGPFTVESLSPHRVIPTEDQPTGPAKDGSDSGPGQFEMIILENLKKAGVQNTIKNERLVFDRLDNYAGQYLQASGEYTESGKSKRVAVCIGPQYGTVGRELIKEAAKEAVKGVGFDLLIVCGFAFDPYVAEETKQYGKLTVLIGRMNPDLSIGPELLKKTGSGNLFMVFGEPDVDIKKQQDGKYSVEIMGVDVYDPTTGQIRNHSTEDIACWFLDTDYNGESFFVRHAYFTGGNEPYEKLKKALRAEIDEAAWATLYSTRSYPFDPPSRGKIAIKVINHYGDEVLKVYEL